MFSREIRKYRNMLIIGHHPYITQGVQQIINSVVAYSFGDFLFDDCTSITGSFKLKQNLSNRKSFVFDVEIENGEISKKKAQGFIDEEKGFRFFDIEDQLNEISEPLNKVEYIGEYKEMRGIQINNAILNKFGKRNLKLVLSRLNYCSIGAFISTRFRKKR